MARSSSTAERLRRHRLAFGLALELGCTPREAEEEMRHREAMERHRKAKARLDARLAVPLQRLLPDAAPPMIEREASEPVQLWWKRDDL